MWGATLPRPAAVVFDCDGTLMDSVAIVERAQDQVLSHYGRSVCTVEERARIHAKSPADIAAVLAELTGVAAWDIEAMLVAQFTDPRAPMARRLPGALVVVELFARVLPIAVASNSNRDFLDQSLRQGQLDGLLKVRICADDVERPKPYPDCYLAACRALGVEATDALAVEDSAVGARAARAAGMAVLGVGPQAACLGADAYVRRLDDPRLHDWLQRWLPTTDTDAAAPRTP
ncbi:HAD family phosphatase [Streptomyces sp. NPDC047197]|uniref:HAD family hydrolase n=1 Tax=Streptomyces sp. NPDC047197 TaxID=3155477 RepID=UPI0033E944FB